MTQRGNGEACHFGLDSSHSIHVVGVVTKNSMYNIDPTMSHQISSVFIALSDQMT